MTCGTARDTLLTLAVCLATLIGSIPASGQVVSPDEYVGFRVGEDRKLFGWDTIVRYFHLLDARSDRVTMQELGRTTLDRPFIMAMISSPTTLLNLARYKNLQKQAANPRHLSDDDAKTLARQNKLVVMLTLNVQAEEIASAQGSIELAYRLATQEDAQTKRILDDLIILLVPSLNPDGLQLVVDWYSQYLNTAFEGSPLPVLSHHYIGRDINHDWLMNQVVETQLVAKQLFHEWYPELIYVQHQAPQYGARVTLPSFNHSLFPPPHSQLIMHSNELVELMASKLKTQDLSGIAFRDVNSVWLAGSLIASANLHNMIALTSFVAGVQVATPLYFPLGSVSSKASEGHAPEFSSDSFAAWSGGWWRLRDAVDYELAIIFSMLDAAASKKQGIIYDFCKMNLESITAASQEKPFAYVIPPSQTDPAAATQMIEVLLKTGIEIHRAPEGFVLNGRNLEPGAFIIYLQQPFRLYVKALFEPEPNTPQVSTANHLHSGREDASGWTLPLQMGVEAIKVAEAFDIESTKLDSVEQTTSLFSKHPENYFISHESNHSLILVNRLLNRRRKVYWLKDQITVNRKIFPPGSIFVPSKEISLQDMQEVSKGLPIGILQTDRRFENMEALQLVKARTGLYRSWTANTDEGWTRLVLDKFEFPFKVIYNSNMIQQNLRKNFDVILIPDMTTDEIINGHHEATRDIYLPRIPKPYRNGITDKGVRNLANFVTEGGVLIALNRACEFAIEALGLPVRSALQPPPAQSFHCESALLEIVVDRGSPLGYGLPGRASAMFSNSPGFLPLPWRRPTNVVAHYSAENPLLSGSCSGAEEIAGLPAVLEIPVGKGRVVLIGFRPLHRGQTSGTFKLVFNAILLANAEHVVLEK